MNKTASQKRHLVFATSKDGKTSKDVQRIFTENINPVKDKLKIRNIRSTENTLIIETETETDAEKIINHASLKDKNIKLEKPRKRNPLVIVYDVEKELNEEEVLQQLYCQNFDKVISEQDFKEECKVRFKTGPWDRPTIHLVMEMTARLRSTRADCMLALPRMRLKIMWLSQGACDVRTLVT